MNKLLTKLGENPTFLASVKKCEKEITPILSRYLTNFPDFTDHSINHSKSVLDYAAYLVEGNIEKLNIDEIYILIMACYLHDIGMSPTNKMLKQIKQSQEYLEFKKSGKGNYKDYIRQIHHVLSYDYIIQNWQKFNIPTERYATAIAVVTKGHRQEELMDEEVFVPKYPVKSGPNFVCLPFLAGILRLSDELDVTNDRMPDLLFDEYLPENKTSKEEWIRHKFNYCVNFDENKIIISSKCSKQIYESMSRHYKKIEDTLTYINKVIRNLPFKDRSLKIEFEKLVPNIETEGFTAKNIGFNLDLQNTLDTVIGNRLYSSKYVAIREALQNSIDSCRYKKTMVPSFSAQIILCLSKNNELSIEDNGLGMDEYIVENFFAKLGSSYYAQKSVSEKFESISEFGIGVFSYFLLCDYFEVETKMRNKEALKFRITKNADTHFFFYDRASRTNSGTKITFFLKESLSFEELEKQLRYYVRFLEFPIYIKAGSTKKIIKSQKFEIIDQQVLSSIVSIAKKDTIKKIGILSKKIENDEYSGICGLILGKDTSKRFIPMSFYNIIEDYKIKISVSHKGIFVFDLNRTGILSDLIGKINLKKKRELNLSRTRLLIREHITKVVSDFVVKIIKELFSSWRQLSSRKKVELTKLFIHRCALSRNLTKEIAESILKYFFVEIHTNLGVNYVSLKSFLNNNPKFILIKCKENCKENNYEKIKKIYKDAKLPILLFYPYVNNDFYLDLFHKLGRKITVKSTRQRSFYVIHNKQKKFDKKFFLAYPSFTFMTMNNNWISTSCDMGIDYPLNTRHHIVKYLFKKDKYIRSNPELNNLWYQFLRELHDTIFHEVCGKNLRNRLVNMNKILNVINKSMNTKLKVLKKDFPIWMQQNLPAH